MLFIACIVTWLTTGATSVLQEAATKRTMMLQLEMTAFCTRAIFSGGTSRPRLPRDRMMPSAADAMDLKLNSAGRASSFAMTCAINIMIPVHGLGRVTDEAGQGYGLRMRVGMGQGW